MGLIRQIIINAFRPWTAALTGDASYELSILAWFVFFVVLRKCVLTLPTKSWALREVVRRPTVVPVLMHSLVTTLAAFAVLARWQDDTIFVWRRLVMPFSCAYWLFDLAFYCWPKSDLLIAVHHIAILICNYPVGDNAGAAALAEIHPQCNTVLCSANGYTLEATTFLLYARWLLANTLTRHHWSYYAISALLLGYVRSELFCPAHAGLSARARLRSSADRVCTRTCSWQAVGLPAAAVRALFSGGAHGTRVPARVAARRVRAHRLRHIHAHGDHVRRVAHA